ncbi:phage head closure protein [Novosphingobium sp. 9U]|uniref:phage head closure protein n=1 Tax=Novosphingobium sp. 9U TaxID=2653158 RepID=UPI0012F3EFA9|nr:phage head closure protein [Novosphingobium sp. 9U]VWX51761.1 Phage head-tail joining protein [Novosphingobium sp. 9U]
MRIESGKLDRRVELLAPMMKQNDIGEVLEQWCAVANFWAQRLELRTVDVARTSGTDDVARGRYLIRYRDDLSTNLRVAIDGTLYAITGIDEPDRRTMMIISVEGL